MKKGPLLLLVLLGFVIIFLAGLRLGTQVEQTNKNISFYLSLPPTKPPEPSPLPLSFYSYSSKACALSFVLPVAALIDKETTTEATFRTKEGEILTISCEKTNPRLQQTIKAGTGVFTFRNQKVPAARSGIYREFILRNSAGKQIYIKVTDSFLPLLEGSLTFTTE